tara:strand:+ start:365 stop:544 length:180 start_codon:yes stop_codon:yes gene_type:complete
MIKVKQKENETRKNYLVRVAIEILEENAYQIDTIEFDEAECDVFCLAEDLRNEFDIDQD